VTGTVTVDCNNGDGVGVFDQPVPVIIDDTVSQDMNVLTANSAGLAYQWVDCDNGNAEIAGADGQSYTAEASGNYAVMITDGECTVTSECTSVTVSGLADNNRIMFNAYPNPVQGILNVELDSFQDRVQIQIYALNGSLVLDQTFTMTNRIRLDLSELNSGNYSLNVLSDGIRTALPVIVE
jgi:hypothetical protein